MTDREQLESDAATLIEVAQRLTRGPYGVAEALRQVHNAGPSSLAKIILERGGEPVWRAWFSACKQIETKHGFNGQVNAKKICDRLEQAPSETKHAFAEEFTRAFAANNTASSDVGDDTLERPPKRTRLPPLHQVSASPAAESPASEPVTPSVVALPSNETGRGLRQTTREMTGVYFGGSLRAARDLFSAQFYDAIKRQPKDDTVVATVAILYQEGKILEMFGCQLVVDIVPERTLSYAQEFFGVTIDVKEGVRLMHYPEGAAVEPNPSITLRGFRKNMLPRIFQSEGCQAAQASPICQRELKDFRDRTNAVTMTIPSRANDCATITVFLGEYEAAIIRKKLFI
jgi:hypothetical protein